MTPLYITPISVVSRLGTPNSLSPLAASYESVLGVIRQMSAYGATRNHAGLAFAMSASITFFDVSHGKAPSRSKFASIQKNSSQILTADSSATTSRHREATCP